MRLHTFIGSVFSQENGKYISPAVMIEDAAASVQVKTITAGTITVQRSVNAKDFTNVPFFELSVNGLAEFNIANAIRGQYVRIVSTVAVEFCNIIS